MAQIVAFAAYNDTICLLLIVLELSKLAPTFYDLVIIGAVFYMGFGQWRRYAPGRFRFRVYPTKLRFGEFFLSNGGRGVFTAQYISAPFLTTYCQSCA